MKTPINPLNVFVYLAAPAVAVGFLASAVPALLGLATATKTAGLIGAAVGLALGLVVGLARRFR